MASHLRLVVIKPQSKLFSLWSPHTAIDISELHHTYPIKEALGNSEAQSGSEQDRSLNEDVLSFAELVLNSNNFEFNGRHYLQKRGTAIGTRIAPSYSNIITDRLERRLIRNAEVKPRIWWRYIDDIFIAWTEGEEKLKEFIDYINNAHDTI